MHTSQTTSFHAQESLFHTPILCHLIPALTVTSTALVSGERLHFLKLPLVSQLVNSPVQFHNYLPLRHWELLFWLTKHNIRLGEIHVMLAIQRENKITGWFSTCPFFPLPIGTQYPYNIHYMKNDKCPGICSGHSLPNHLPGGLRTIIGKSAITNRSREITKNAGDIPLTNLIHSSLSALSFFLTAFNNEISPQELCWVGHLSGLLSTWQKHPWFLFV